MATLTVAINAARAISGANDFRRAGRAIETSATRVEKGLRRAQDRVRNFGKRASSTGKQASALGLALKRLVAIVGAMAIFRRVIRVISEFQKSMATLRGVTRATAEEMAKMEKVARRLGATTEFTASQAADSLVNLGRAGFSAQESTNALAGVLDLATAGSLDLADAARLTANTIRQFSLDASAASDVGGILVATTNAANTNITELGEALKLVGPVASSLNFTLEETAASLGVLGDAGITASLAGTGLRGILSRLLERSERNVKAFAKLGLSMEDLDPRTQSLADVFDKLNAAGFDAQSAIEIFGRRSFTAAVILSRTTERTRELTKEIEANRDAARRNAEMIRDTLHGDIKNLVSAFDELILSAGDKGLAKALRGLVKGITAFVRLLAGVEGAMDNATVATWLIVSALTVLTVIIAAKAFTLFVTTLIGMGAALAGAAASAGALVAALSPLLVVLLPILAALAGFELGRFLHDSFPGVQKALQKVIQSFEKFGDDLLTTWDYVTRAIPIMFDDAMSGVLGSETWKDLKIMFRLSGLVPDKEADKKIVDTLTKTVPGAMDRFAGGLSRTILGGGRRRKFSEGELRVGFTPAGGPPGPRTPIAPPTREEELRAEIDLLNERLKKTKSLAELENVLGKRSLARRELMRLELEQTNKNIDKDFEQRERQGKVAKDFWSFVKKDANELLKLLGLTSNAVEDTTKKMIEAADKNKITQDQIRQAMLDAQKAAEEADKRLKKNEAKAKLVAEAYQGMGQAVGEAFESIVFDAENAADALEALAREVSRIAFRVFVTQQLAGFIGGLSPKFTGGGGGSVGQGITTGTGVVGSVGAAQTATSASMAVGAMTAAPTVVQVTQNITTPDAQSFRKSKTQISRDARDVLRGTV